MIVGGRIVSVEAKKDLDKAPEGMNVNIDITSLEATDGRLLVKYSYTIKYLPDSATMVIKGELFAEEDKDKRKAIEDEWKKSKTLTSDFAEDVLTAVTYSGSTVGTLLAYAINVNAPLNIPRARLNPQAQKRDANTAS